MLELDHTSVSLNACCLSHHTRGPLWSHAGWTRQAVVPPAMVLDSVGLAGFSPLQVQLMVEGSLHRNPCVSVRAAVR